MHEIAKHGNADHGMHKIQASELFHERECMNLKNTQLEKLEMYLNSWAYRNAHLRMNNKRLHTK